MRSRHCWPLRRALVRLLKAPTTTSTMAMIRTSHRKPSTIGNWKVRLTRIGPRGSRLLLATCPLVDQATRARVGYPAGPGYPTSARSAGLWLEREQHVPSDLVDRLLRRRVLDDVDRRVGAVSELVAGEGPGQALEVLGGVQLVHELLPVDVDRPVAVPDRHLFDGGEEHVGGVVGMRVEGLDGLLPVLLLVLADEVLIARPGRGCRPGEVHALGLPDDDVGVGEQTVGPEQLLR